MEKRNVLPAYPGFTRRALTFTIDDGNIKYDEKFINILRPHGIRGTFNLCSHTMDREDGFYREFYRGFGIANHTEYHPYAMEDGIEYVVVDEPPTDQPPDEAKIYPSVRGEGFYMKHYPHGWRELADNARYKKTVTDCQMRLERVFGEGNVVGFVWPYHEPKNAEIQSFVSKLGFTSVRKTGDTLDKTDFAIPEDRMAWSYNAHDTNLFEVMEKYVTAPDNGSLRFFAFGVHSYDFERNGTWDVLTAFAERYGDRPSDFWYAPVDEIFAYADAMERLRVTDTEIVNPTEITLYVELDGEQITVPPHTTLTK